MAVTYLGKAGKLLCSHSFLLGRRGRQLPRRHRGASLNGVRLELRYRWTIAEATCEKETGKSRIYFIIYAPKKKATCKTSADVRCNEIPLVVVLPTP